MALQFLHQVLTNVLLPALPREASTDLHEHPVGEGHDFILPKHALNRSIWPGNILAQSLAEAADHLRLPRDLHTSKELEMWKNIETKLPIQHVFVHAGETIHISGLELVASLVLGAARELLGR